MNTIKHILCPVDFSEYSDEALNYAMQLAEANASDVHLLHVLPQINYYDWSLTGMSAMISEEVYGKLKEDAVHKISKMIKGVNTNYPKISISYKIEEYSIPSESILNEAKEKKIDMIILGSHGRKGLERILMGSVAESILRHADCNVLIYKKAR
jgi:universal stress protein A